MVVPDLPVLTYMSPVCLSLLTLMLWKVYVFPSKTESMKSAHKTNFIVVDGSTSIASCICKFFDLISLGGCSLATFCVTVTS